MERLNLSTAKAVKIEVNDNGDYITLNMADREFPKRFMTLFTNIKKKCEEMAAKAEELDKITAEEQLDAEIAVYRDIMKEIDCLLGEGSCKKIFGDIVPDLFAITELFEQLLLLIQKYGNERKGQMQSKYNAARRGAQ